MGASGSQGCGATELATRFGRFHGSFRGSDPGIRINLTREVGMKLGLMVNILLDSGLLLISEVQVGGLVEAWNMSHGEQEQVRRGDWIISVNGVSGTAGTMFGQLQRHGDLELVISRQRPINAPRRSGSACRKAPKESLLQEQVRFPITVEIPENQTLGVEVSISPRGVLIVEISDGIMKEWNAKNPSKEVRVGDRIVFANGTGRNDMIAELWKTGTLHMVVRRGPDIGKGEVLSEHAVEQIPTVTFTDHEVHRCEGDACGICLDEWAPGSEALELPCKHRFHKDCAVPWLTKHSALCPLCGWAADHNRGCCGDAVDASLPVIDDDALEEALSNVRRMPKSMITGAMQAGRAHCMS